MAYIPQSGSVVAFEGGSPWSFVGSVQTVAVANQSISGTVVSSILGTVPVTQVTSPWVVSGFPANQSVSGTVGASIIGAVPVTGFPANQSVSGTVGTSQTGTVMSSIVSTVPSSVLVGASIFGALPGGNAVIGAVAASISGVVNIAGSVAALITNTNINVSGSVAALITNANVNVSGSVAALITNANVNVSGSVVGFQGGTQITSIVSSIPSSVLVGASIFGALPGGNNILGAVAASISGVVNVAGSVVGFQGGSWSASMVGATYAEDTQAATGQLGVFVLGVRNDTLASVTNADNDYGAFTIDAAGALMTVPAPITTWVVGNASCFTGVEQPVIAAQGASIFTYVNSLQVSNQSATAARLAIRNAAGGTVLANIIVPANSGFTFNVPTGFKTLANAAFTASINAVASVYVNAQGFISKI